MMSRCRWRAAGAGLWLIVALAASGCSGVTPTEYRDNREEGPEQGLFTGSAGEFVIIAPAKNSAKNEPPAPEPAKPAQ